MKEESLDNTPDVSYMGVNDKQQTNYKLLFNNLDDSNVSQSLNNQNSKSITPNNEIY